MSMYLCTFVGTITVKINKFSKAARSRVNLLKPKSYIMFHQL